MDVQNHRRNHRKDDPQVQISKNLSYLLRHGAKEEGLNIDQAGYVRLDEILSKKFYTSRKITFKEIKEVVDTNSKKRFELKTENDSQGNPVVYIRASHGHSLDIADDTLLKKIQDPSKYPACLLGVHLKSWETIKNDGITETSKNYIHFTLTYPSDSELSETKSSRNVFIDVDMEKAMRDGIDFFISPNNFILTPGINGVLPPKYFKKVTIHDRSNGTIQEIDPKEYQNNKVAPQPPNNNVEEHKDSPIVNGSKSWKENRVHSNFSNNNCLKYLCALDFQAQCDKEKKLDIEEIIELSVVIIDIENKRILDEQIHHFIKPVSYPQLFPYCTELTGITQEQVDKGVSLEQALDELDNHLKKIGILNSNFCFVTCGDWDLCTGLKKEAKAKNLKVKEYLKSWINLKVHYPVPEDFPLKRLKLEDMLIFSNINENTKGYPGVNNANNIANVIISLLEQDFEFLSTMISNLRY